LASTVEESANILAVVVSNIAVRELSGMLYDSSSCRRLSKPSPTASSAVMLMRETSLSTRSPPDHQAFWISNPIYHLFESTGKERIDFFASRSSRET
jgi:hypothetical protein